MKNFIIFAAVAIVMIVVIGCSKDETNDGWTAAQVQCSGAWTLTSGAVGTPDYHEWTGTGYEDVYLPDGVHCVVLQGSSDAAARVIISRDNGDRVTDAICPIGADPVQVCW